MSTKSAAAKKRSTVLPFPTPPKARAPRPTPGVVGQVRMALHPRNRLATLVGFLLGAFAPVGAFRLSHADLPASSGAFHTVLTAIVIGALVFSAKTVWQWSRLAFQDTWKATGYVLLLEGVMVFSTTTWLAWMALGLLVTINGVATGCNLARGK